MSSVAPFGDEVRGGPEGGPIVRLATEGLPAMPRMRTGRLMCRMNTLRVTYRPGRKPACQRRIPDRQPIATTAEDATDLRRKGRRLASHPEFPDVNARVIECQDMPLLRRRHPPRDVVDVGDYMIVPTDAAKREDAVGYPREEDAELSVTVAARHWVQFTNGAGR